MHRVRFFSINAPDEQPRITRELLKRVMLYAIPYRAWIVGMLVFTLATSGMSLLTPLIMRDLIDHTLPSGNLSRLGGLLIALLAIPLVTGGLNIMIRQLNARIGEGVVYDLRVALFSHLQRMSLNFFTHTKIGELMSRLNNDVVGAQNAISNTFINIGTNIIRTIALLVVMLALEWRLTLISIIILPFFLIAARNLGRRLRDITRLHMDFNAKMNAIANELLNIGGVLLVKLFGKIEDEDDRFRHRAAEVRDNGVRRAVSGMMLFVTIGLLSAVGTALVYGIGGYMVIQQHITIGTIVALGTYLGSLYGSLQNLTNAPVDFATSMVSFERVFEVLDLPLEINEKPDARILKNISGLLSFEDVSFKYHFDANGLLKDVRRFGKMQDIQAVLTGDVLQQSDEIKHTQDSNEMPISSLTREWILERVSFQAEPGQLVALVGPSGAGKTTLTYLIPRLYDPTKGRVLIDGHNVKDVTLASLVDQIGMVTQETHLFHDTIAINLRYAKENASQAEIESASRAANIHEFISGLPDQYETIVGERGYRLSGGEKQRIALARVILKDPRILVLDEATSSLDSESEALIQEALKRVMSNRTSIVIAHRLSTILAADQILVMEYGKIVERGTHTQLLEINGLYSRLYNTQFKLQNI